MSHNKCEWVFGNGCVGDAFSVDFVATYFDASLLCAVPTTADSDNVTGRR